MRAQDAVREYWNRLPLVEGYDTWMRPDQQAKARAAWQEELRRALPPPPLQVVDLGCGTGYISLLLAEAGYAVRGIDAAPNMLAIARGKAEHLGLPVRFEQGDAHDPPGTPSSADVITARHLFWTLEQPDAAMAGAFWLLRPGGRLVIIDGLWHTEGYQHSSADSPSDTDSQRAYSADVVRALPLIEAQSTDPLQALAREAGFREVKLVPATVVARFAEQAENTRWMTATFVLTAEKPT